MLRTRQGPLVAARENLVAITTSDPGVILVLPMSQPSWQVLEPVASQPVPVTVKTCIICRAQVPVDADGNIPDGGMPCGH